MTFSVLATGLFLFFAVLALHVLLWNLFKIKKEMFWLAAVFIVAPGIVAALSWALGIAHASSTIASGMLYAALAAVYIQTYPALREDIPSIRILMTIHAAANGMTRREIIDRLMRQKLFATKITDLENDALISIQEDRMRLTVMGAALARIFQTYRKLLGHAAGRG